MKRVLHISAREGGDWGQDLIHAGLVRFLGPERVIDFPYHLKHVEPLAFTGDPEHDWGLERRTVGWTPQNVLVPNMTELEVTRALRNGQVDLIFIDETDESFEQFLRVRANIVADAPVVVVAGHDSFQNSDPLFVADRFGRRRIRCMFLDNWQRWYDDLVNYGVKAAVYNWSINFDHYWTPHRTQEKKYDISFQGYSSHPNRAKVVDHILSKWNHLSLKIDLEREPGTMRSFIRKSDYFDVMAQSKICLNLRGAAENGKTLRFYEIPYVGSLMLTEESGAAQVEPFLEKQHCLYFDSMDQLDRQIEWALENDKRRNWVAWQGHSHAMAHHTVDARINQMYGVLNGSR